MARCLELQLKWAEKEQWCTINENKTIMEIGFRPNTRNMTFIKNLAQVAFDCQVNIPLEPESIKKMCKKLKEHARGEMLTSCRDGEVTKHMTGHMSRTWSYDVKRHKFWWLGRIGASY